MKRNTKALTLSLILVASLLAYQNCMKGFEPLRNQLSSEQSQLIRTPETEMDEIDPVSIIIQSVVTQIHLENPNLVANSCASKGGTNDFLFKAAQELKKIDSRFGLKWVNGVRGDLSTDEITYALALGPFGEELLYEESSQISSYKIIKDMCGANPQPQALRVSNPSGSFAGLLTIPPEIALVKKETPPPYMFWVVKEVHRKNPNLIKSACKDSHEFLFEVVKKLREIDPRWGLNWKRSVVGDMSDDVVNYAYQDTPYENSAHAIVDVIQGCGGPDPQPAWGWVDTRVGGWTLEPLRK